MFRLEIHHTEAIDGIPVERLDEMTAKWRAMPVWKKLLRRPPLVRIGKKLTIREEPLDGTYDTLEAAREAAAQLAHDLVGEIRPDSAVAVVRVADDHNMGSINPS